MELLTIHVTWNGVRVGVTLTPNKDTAHDVGTPASVVRRGRGVAWDADNYDIACAADDSVRDALGKYVLEAIRIRRAETDTLF